jgi:two-component system cell cycle sensor histidine kinase/response regulator CckA
MSEPLRSETSPDGDGRDGPAAYRRLVDACPVGMFSLDGDGRFSYVNPALAGWWGGTAPELTGRPFHDIVVPEERERVGGRLSFGPGAGPGAVALEFGGRTRTGAARVYRLHARPAVEDGRVVGAHGLVLDVTEDRRLEEALRSSEEQFRLLMDGSEQVFFYVHDRDGVFQYLSPSVESVVGYRPEEMVGRNYEAFHPAGGIRDEVRRRTEEGLQDRASGKPYEAVLRTRDGSLVHLEITESPLRVDGQVVGLRGFARDITARKRLEEKLRQSQKMEAVGQLAGGVAHDFNNLLTSIIGHLELALSELDEDDPLREELLEAQRSSGRAAELTRQLLAFSRKQVLRPRVIDLNDVVRELTRLLERLIGEQVELRTELCPEPARVLADQGQVEQVIVNLAVNARDAMPQGGVLRIETRRHRGALAGVAGDGEDPLVRLSVSDSGRGMDEAVKARVFEPFFTTKEQGRGTGLGLSTVYGIVTQTGGAIQVESAPGEGTVFHVDLRESVGQLPAEVRQPIEELAPGSGRVLVVEDEDGVRMLCTKILRRHGYEVVGVSDGPAALARLQAEAGAFDLVLTDVVMPGLSGPEVLREARRLQPGIRGVAMSGYTEQAITHHGVLEETPHFLQKPFTSEELLRLVAVALNSEPAGERGAPPPTDPVPPGA